MGPTNSCPGEDGRVAQVAAGKGPARSREFNTLQVHATGEAWLGHQMLQTSTKTPSNGPFLYCSQLGTVLCQ
eukprot:9475959-Pyramimonas_sp.AAC.1